MEFVTGLAVVEKRAKRKPKAKALPPLARNDTHAAKYERSIDRLARRVFRRIRATIVARASRHEKDAADRLRDFLSSLKDDDFAWTEAERDELRDLLTEVALERGDGEIRRLTRGASADEIEQLLSQANERAIAWAQERAGNLITDVSDVTRDAVNEMTAAAIRDGITTEEFAEQLSGAWEFSTDRATVIARTEMATAETAGTLQGYAASGVVEGKGWSADDEACDECEPMDGEEVPLEDAFSNGDDGPPAHPNCRCVIYPVAVVPEDSDSE